jgi:hypothetical protein
MRCDRRAARVGGTPQSRGHLAGVGFDGFRKVGTAARQSPRHTFIEAVGTASRRRPSGRAPARGRSRSATALATSHFHHKSRNRQLEGQSRRSPQELPLTRLGWYAPLDQVDRWALDLKTAVADSFDDSSRRVSGRSPRSTGCLQQAISSPPRPDRRPDVHARRTTKLQGRCSADRRHQKGDLESCSPGRLDVQ